jgi:signal transduction histidine kinase
MKKLSVKVLVATFMAITVASFIPNIIMFLTDSDQSFRDGRPNAIAMLISISVIAFIFNRVMSKIVVKRINKLSNATKLVVEGNYNTLEVKGNKDEINQLIENFNIMVNSLKRNEYQNKEFVRNFSHELKTPLAAINGYSELLASDNITNEERIEYSQIIASESRRLSNLSKNMLMISQIDSDSIIAKNDDIIVSEQIRNVLLLTQISWEEKEIELELDVEDFKVVTNKELLHQVWLNLISNAIKFTPLNEKLTIKLTEDDSSYHFEISNPIDYEIEDKERLFDLFYIEEAARTETSSGVGLTLTKKIVERLSGTINLEIKENFVVKINLPK